MGVLDAISGCVVWNILVCWWQYLGMWWAISRCVGGNIWIFGGNILVSGWQYLDLFVTINFSLVGNIWVCWW